MISSYDSFFHAGEDGGKSLKTRKEQEDKEARTNVVGRKGAIIRVR